MITSVIVAFLSYISGAIPFSFLIVKVVKGEDLRDVGSGNVGATNAGRVLGKFGFISSFVMDMLKAFIPLYIFRNVFDISDNLLLLSAFCIIIGHTYTIFLKFKGGKGVATGVGIFLALSPLSLLWAMIVFIVVTSAFKMVSLGSVLASVALSVTVFANSNWLGLKIFTLLVVVFIIYKHKSNIKRIIKGEESKIGSKKL